MQQHNAKWFYLAILSVIWGSSYILIKKGLIGFTPLQLGAVRILMTTVILYIFGLKSLKKVKGKKLWFWMAVSGFLGTFFPAFLFSYAETEIDSSVASILNSLVPLFTIIFGAFIFKFVIKQSQYLGVFIGLLGSFLLIYDGLSINPDRNHLYAGFVLIATVCYALNVNIIKKYLNEVSSMAIAVGNFTTIAIPAIIVLFASGATELDYTGDAKVKEALLWVLLLSIFGTAVAKVLFNKLVQISNPVFSSSVTYTIPIVAVLWGVLDGERLGALQFLATGVILLGVYLVNRDR